MIMRKILSIFAAALVAISVSADPVVLPATLDVNNVSFRSEGMPDFVIEEGQEYAGTYFDMGAHDSANDTLLYAEWDVTIEPIQYNISVDVYNTNSWRVQLYVLNQAGDTVKGLRYKGSSGQCGHYAIGAIDMRDLEAGNYKVRAHAATAWSAMKLKDVIFEADYQGVEVALPGTLLPAYAELSANASVNADGALAFKPSTAHNEYANWNVSFAQAGTYNVSIDITASNGHNYGVELIGEDEETIYGAVNEGGQHGDTGIKELGTITVPAAGNYIVHLTNAIQWSEAVLNSITFAAPEVVLPYMAIIGDMNGWAGTELVPAEDKLTASVTINLAMNDNSGYGFKVLVGETAYCIEPTTEWYTFHRDWTSASNIDHVALENEAFWLHIDKAGDYTFTWTIAEKKLDITFPDLENITYYFVNTPNWASVYAYAWDPEIAQWPGEAATLTEETVWDYAIYSYTMPENRRHIIFNDGIGGDGHQTADLTVEDGKPYYYKAQWFESLNAVVTAISNTEAVKPVEKMIENGQLILIKNGVKYNAIGTVVK